MKLIKALQGYKTYIIGAAAAVALFLKMNGVPVPNELFAFLGVAVTFTVGAKINRLAK